MWIHSHEPFPNSIHAYVKHKDSLHCILEDHFFLIIWPCHPNSQNHTLQATSLLPYLSYHRCHKKVKMINQPFPIVCIAWFCLYWSGVFMLCYFYIIVWYRVQRVLLREVKELKLQKGKWHTCFYPILLYALVFFSSSMHDRLVLKGKLCNARS
jgi:hypothetical protein